MVRLRNASDLHRIVPRLYPSTQNGSITPIVLPHVKLKLRVKAALCRFTYRDVCCRSFAVRRGGQLTDCRDGCSTVVA